MKFAGRPLRDFDCFILFRGHLLLIAGDNRGNCCSGSTPHQKTTKVMNPQTRVTNYKNQDFPYAVFLHNSKRKSHSRRLLQLESLDEST